MLKQNQLYRFVRPSLFALAIGVAFIVSARVMQTLRRADATDLRQTSLAASFKLPTPALHPSDVIRLQVEALRDQTSPGFGALQCYCFAAPENRLVTGPLERFAQMVRAEPFKRIGDARDFSVGSEEHFEDYVRVLVVVVDDDQRMSAFNWVLQRHTEPPFQNCWLTVGVFLKHQGQRPEYTPEEPKNLL